MVDSRAIHIVEQHYAIAREAVASWQGDAHVEVGRGRFSRPYDVKVLLGVETDVTSGVFQHAAGRENGLVRHKQGEGQLVVPP